MAGKTSKTLHELIKAVFLVAISLLVSVVLVEVLLRTCNYPPRKEASFLFFTRPALKDQKTDFGYHRNLKIREVAVYKTRKGFRVEYDTSYSTNNLGLVQKTNFDPQKKSLVFIGDSFTQGEGAPPWFYKLEEKWPHNEYQLVNLGIIGTGIVQWQEALKWFAQKGAVNHVFILFISDDWLRRRWYNHDDLQGTSFWFCTDCPRNNGVCNNRTKLGILYMEKDWDTPTILKKARELPQPRMQPGFKGFWNNLYFRQLLKLTVPSTRNRRKQQKIIDKNLEAFDQIISRFGRENITVLHIPLKGEAIRGDYTWVGKEAKDLVLARHVAYLDGLALCGMTEKDFHVHDSHPNASGYAKILTCIEAHALKNNQFH
jgi:hypothetical protein